MHEQFEVHELSPDGLIVARAIALKFDDLLTELEAAPMDPRCLALVRTKLEEACFFAKKGYASLRT